MVVAPIVLIIMGLTPFLIWCVGFGVCYALWRMRRKRARSDQARAQMRELFIRDLKVMTTVWAVVGCTVTVVMLIWAFVL